MEELLLLLLQLLHTKSESTVEMVTGSAVIIAQLRLRLLHTKINSSRIIKKENKQDKQKLQMNNYVAINWFIKIHARKKNKKKGESSHQYNRSYTLNCKTYYYLYDKQSLLINEIMKKTHN